MLEFDVIWHLGNTTVRTPYRLRDALRVLQGSPLNGNISGSDMENAFAVLLHNEGVVSSPRVDTGGDASDLGRKWRVALSQLGFITPLDPTSAADEIEELSGASYEITPNGYRLAESESTIAQQECFLRSLASYRIPSPIEKKHKCNNFSPLRFILFVINKLTENGYEGSLSVQEFGLHIQTSTPEDGINEIFEKIINYRSGRVRTRGDVKRYDKELFEKLSSKVGKAYNTIAYDYPDVSFRYLKATGLFIESGRGLSVSPSRLQLAALLCSGEEVVPDNKEYLHSLWQGAKLPTDDSKSSYIVIKNLVQHLRDRGVQAELPTTGMALPELEKRRHELEETISQLDEKKYANNQADQIDEIMAWLKAIPTHGSAKFPDGGTVSIPKGERPAYLEWIIWRAFLAINNLCNDPWEARRFPVDQNFLPINCAPGGGPDMIFEFKDMIVVVEVTLTVSSRQEAAEGEPVRRHVAQYAEQSKKPVYGLFIAVTIDNNTAHTFRSGDWYRPDDSKLSLDIVPLALEDFRTFLDSGRERLPDMPSLLRQLIIECRAKSNQDAPQWKQAIRSIARQTSDRQA